MKRRAGGILISLSALLLIGLSLVFWVNYPKFSGTPQKEEIKTWEQLIEEETVKKTEAAQAEMESSENRNESQEETSSGLGEDSQSDNTNSLGGQNGFQETENGSQQQEEATIVFAGDVYISSYVEENYKKSGISGVISENLLAEMGNADITMVNQEFPFSLGGSRAPDKQFTFRVDPLYTSMLTEMGIDIVTLANNHALDYGTEALTDTFEALDAAGVDYVGAGADQERAMQPCIIQAGQRSYGFLAASRVIPVTDWNIENRQPGMLCTYDSKQLCKSIKKAKEVCDFLTVYVHWGIEKSEMPEDYQRQLAQNYIDAGADLVIGAHPHVLQGIEYYNGKPIVYSLGNYIFNQEIASTMLLKVRVSPDNQPALQLIPASASGARTQEMSSDEAKELYQYMESISFGISVSDDGTVAQK